MDLLLGLKGLARAAQRSAADLATGDAFHLARPSDERRDVGLGLPERLVQVQPIRVTETVAAKRHNLWLASRLVDGVAVFPGETFSFWALVGRPTQGNGFERSRALVRGRLEESAGGGLCQLSGMLYALALRAGLPIRERHAHSVDLYDDRTRYAPLGADATVVWGRKDLRFANDLGSALAFCVRVERHQIRVALCSRAPVALREVEHRVVERGGRYVTVLTLRRRDERPTELVDRSRYFLPECVGYY